MTSRLVPARLIDLRQAEAEYGISFWTLRTLISNGSLPVVRLPGVRRLFLDRKDVDLALERWKERAAS